MKIYSNVIAAIFALILAVTVTLGMYPSKILIALAFLITGVYFAEDAVREVDK